jgi:hypothetical protein
MSLSRAATHTCTLPDMSLCPGRPIGGGTCGNLRDAATTVSSVGMCASYAWKNQKTGFCILEGTQCFTSSSSGSSSNDDGFQTAFDASEQVPCNTDGAMTCFTFESQPQARRSTNLAGGTRRSQLQLSMVCFSRMFSLSHTQSHCSGEICCFYKRDRACNDVCSNFDRTNSCISMYVHTCIHTYNGNELLQVDHNSGYTVHFMNH